MPIPHTIQMQIIKKRLRGKEGKEKLREIERISDELPGFSTGPYGKIKKWLKDEIDKTKTKSKIKHQDWIGVKREGVRQFVLVGLPSAGKSSLIKKMCGLQTKIAAYEFTTLKPIPGTVIINDAEIQLVDLPGLIKGASEDVGGGRRLLGIIRDSDGILLMHDLSKPVHATDDIVNELKKVNIQKQILVIGNKIDLEGAKENLTNLKQNFPEHKVISVSTVTSEGLQELKDVIWNMSRLIRVYPKEQKQPVILDKESTVETFIRRIHTDMVTQFKFARVTGTSVKYPNQQVGLKHQLDDEDVIELVLKK